MTSANEHEDARHEKPRGPGYRPADLDHPPVQTAARAARRVAVEHRTGGARRRRQARRDDPARSGRAREGAATLDDQGHHLPGGPGTDAAQPAPERPQAGDPDGDRPGPRAAEGRTPPQGGVAGPAAQEADLAGAGDAAGGRPDPGEAQSGLARGAAGMFRSLRNRNYRLFASGQAVSNIGTWMQRVGQDWLLLQRTHGSGIALGVNTALQFLPLLLFGLWGGVIADRYRMCRVLLATQTAMGTQALVLGVLVVTGSAQVWHVYVLAFC